MAVGRGVIPWWARKVPQGEKNRTLLFFLLPSCGFLYTPCVRKPVLFVFLKSLARNSLVQAGCRVEGGVALASRPLSL